MNYQLVTSKQNKKHAKCFRYSLYFLFYPLKDSFLKLFTQIILTLNEDFFLQFYTKKKFVSENSDD